MELLTFQNLLRSVLEASHETENAEDFVRWIWNQVEPKFNNLVEDLKKPGNGF